MSKRHLRIIVNQNKQNQNERRTSTNEPKSNTQIIQKQVRIAENHALVSLVCLVFFSFVVFYFEKTKENQRKPKKPNKPNIANRKTVKTERKKQKKSLSKLVPHTPLPLFKQKVGCAEVWYVVTQMEGTLPEQTVCCLRNKSIYVVMSQLTRSMCKKTTCSKPSCFATFSKP